jgi:hypothetical protein
MRRLSISTLLAAALVAASVGIGSWKVVEVRRENTRLAVQASRCMVRNEAFLDMMRAAGEGRRARAAAESRP